MDETYNVLEIDADVEIQTVNTNMVISIWRTVEKCNLMFIGRWLQRKSLEIEAKVEILNSDYVMEEIVS